MTKKYIINGKEIQFDLPDGNYEKGSKEIFFALTNLLEALDEKKEECEHKFMPHLLNCIRCGRSKEDVEPKSTLREEINSIIYDLAGTDFDGKEADKIISLFKDTLLKEIEKAEPLRLQGESPDFTQGQEWTMTQIKQIIKNI